MKRGTLCTKSPLAGLGLRCSGAFRIVSEKWTDQCEDCSLKKRSHCYSRAFLLEKIKRRLKKVTAIVGHFSLERKRANLKQSRLLNSVAIWLKNTIILRFDGYSAFTRPVSMGYVLCDVKQNRLRFGYQNTDPSTDVVIFRPLIMG